VGKSTIFFDDLHFETFMALFESARFRFKWNCEYYCLMPNHYHLILEALRPRLSRGMHWLNGRYAQWFNTVHGRAGHVFQNRFGAYVIDTDAHFERACAYIEENPVRAGLCANPEDWPWSSAHARGQQG
jgi:REP element-mobilizing transposase RayT